MSARKKRMPGRHTQDGARPVIARLVHLARALREGRPVNGPRMAAELEVCVRTVARDLDFLSDRLRYDFDYDPRRHVYTLRSAPEAVL